MAILALGCALALSACGDRKAQSGAASGPAPGPADAGKVLNLYIWSDYLAANTLADFEKQTGIKVHVAYFDTNETLETKLLAGSSGYDVVVPTASYFERQIKAGVYLPIDKSKLSNLKNMDPQLMSKVALHDPGNGKMFGVLVAEGVVPCANPVSAVFPQKREKWHPLACLEVSRMTASCRARPPRPPSRCARETRRCGRGAPAPPEGDRQTWRWRASPRGDRPGASPGARTSWAAPSRWARSAATAR